MPAWVGLCVTLLGMGYAGYNQFILPYRKQLPLIQQQQIPPLIQQQQIPPLIQQQQQIENRPIAYCQIQIAYDPTYNKHYFQHLDGSWKEYPPTPNLY